MNGTEQITWALGGAIGGGLGIVSIIALLLRQRGDISEIRGLLSGISDRLAQQDRWLTVHSDRIHTLEERAKDVCPLHAEIVKGVEAVRQDIERRMREQEKQTKERV